MREGDDTNHPPSILNTDYGNHGIIVKIYPIVVEADSIVATTPATPPVVAAVDTTAMPATCVAAAADAVEPITAPIVPAAVAAAPAPGNAILVAIPAIIGAPPGTNTEAVAAAPATVAPAAP